MDQDALNAAGIRTKYVDNGDGTYAEKVVASFSTGSSLPAVAVATSGDRFSTDGPLTISRNADGTIAYLEIASGSDAYRQTWTHTNGLLTSTTGWVKQ